VGKEYLEFFEIGFGIIDQGEASRLSASELRAETEGLDGFFGDFVHPGETGTDIVFRKVGFGGVKDIDDLCEQRQQPFYQPGLDGDIQIACG
jgi:hypothetical protein